MELLCIVKKNKTKKIKKKETKHTKKDGKKKGGWHTVYNDVIICLRKDLYYCFKCALILRFSFFAV